MATSTLVVHRGARLVERADLDSIPTPPATATWFPVAHSQVLQEVTGRLADAGFQVRKAQHAVSRNDARYFGTLDLESPLVTGVSLAVGVRNSTDKSYAEFSVMRSWSGKSVPGEGEGSLLAT